MIFGRRYYDGVLIAVSFAMFALVDEIFIQY